MIDFAEYDNCWFEIRTIDTRIVMRNREDFLRKSTALSKLHDLTLYKIERSTFGSRRSRMHLLG